MKPLSGPVAPFSGEREGFLRQNDQAFAVK
jgi:hypothetical protein